jgi:ubiquinone/menaquinone biosynthesis C-methylase UbiE
MIDIENQLISSSKLKRSVKEFCELTYWKLKHLSQSVFENAHYQYFYTTYFSLSNNYYGDKTILDIGCGPRGSLEWANMAKERIGVDPLADKYLKMGAVRHKMTYIKAYVEQLPFPDNYFDVVCAFNSLDHIENISLAASEIRRVLKPGGLFLLIVDIHCLKTFTEPQTFNWNILNDYFADFEVIEERHLQRINKSGIYSNLRLNKPVSEHAVNGVLTAKLLKSA